MKFLDILKKFKDEIRLELDIYNADSYQQMITKIKIEIDILQVFKENKKFFDLEQSFYISNISSKKVSEYPYIITNLDYDTIGIEIDYNLLTLLRVDVSNLSNRLTRNNKIVNNLTLNYVELIYLLNSIVSKLEYKIQNIDYSNITIINTYKNICKMYDDNTDSIIQDIKKIEKKKQIKQKVKLIYNNIYNIIYNNFIIINYIINYIISYCKQSKHKVNKLINFIYIIILFKLKRSYNDKKTKDTK